jgi:hypothetical protein
MRKPRPGEEPDGLFEQAMAEAGIKEWKLDPDERVYVREQLRIALHEEAEELLKLYPEKKRKKGEGQTT